MHLRLYFSSHSFRIFVVTHFTVFIIASIVSSSSCAVFSFFDQETNHYAFLFGLILTHVDRLEDITGPVSTLIYDHPALDLPSQNTMDEEYDVNP
jgi:hypothetical protein